MKRLAIILFYPIFIAIAKTYSSHLLKLCCVNMNVSKSNFQAKPRAKISKYREVPSTKELFQDLRGRVKYIENITTPTTEEWKEI